MGSAQVRNQVLGIRSENILSQRMEFNGLYGLGHVAYD